MVTKLVLHLRPDMRASAEPVKETTSHSEPSQITPEVGGGESFKNFIFKEYIQIETYYNPKYKRQEKRLRIKPEHASSFPLLSKIETEEDDSPIYPFIQSLLATIGKEDKDLGFRAEDSSRGGPFPRYNESMPSLIYWTSKLLNDRIYSVIFGYPAPYHSDQYALDRMSRPLTDYISEWDKMFTE